MKKICLFLALSSLVFSSEKTDYFQLLKEYPLLATPGNSKLGEVEIVFDADQIESIEKAQAARLIKKGLSESVAKESVRVGVVAEDVYWVWLRDAVLFPTGAAGTYDRLLWKCSLEQKSCGVAVLPQMPDGRFALNLNYRHATRSWELELPRGGLLPGESPEEGARREVKEETGLLVKVLISLGCVAPDSGTLSSIVPVFLGRIEGAQEAEVEESEAILGIRLFTADELRKGLVLGKLPVDMNGEVKKVPLRDAFLTFALFQLTARELQ